MGETFRVAIARDDKNCDHYTKTLIVLIDLKMIKTRTPVIETTNVDDI